MPKRPDTDLPSTESGDAGRAGQDPRQTLLDALPAEVALLNADGRIDAVNAAWYCAADADSGDDALRDGVGLDYLAVCRAVAGGEPERAAQVAEGIAGVLARRLPQFLYEYPCHMPDSWRWMTLSATPLDDGSGGAVVVRTNITERKLGGRDVRETRDAMARIARLNAVGILAASLVHELTQPLSAAAFFTSTAAALLGRDDQPDDRLTAVLERIDEQIQRASSTLHRLRAFLRQQEMDLRPVPLGSIIDRAVGMVRGFAADHRVRVALDPAAPGIQVVGDAPQLEQVLVNLICNGIQAIDAGDMSERLVQIEVRRPTGEAAFGAERKRERGPAPMVRVSIRDTGPGLPDGDAEVLFDIFRATRDAGLGLGLAISRSIVESHGGRLWAERAPRHGACFHFTLPLTDTGEP